ncbi:mll8367 [Mesorhizobium japonicum MAFF 303099]|uniref:Mll8367 protein n=1 Tax=Mesorhizobium japonicum (strain LMG 29417 / CECT 9101 / MAFF 303099) TaxID=266835 RepID=Q983E1_RHILO|nr:mll8367 [Mesorhizobium japonicum MAFF 303099]
MFAGLVSSLMSGDVATQELLAQRGDQAKAIFRSMGLKSSSSGKLLDQYIAGGLGAEPMVIGYENQLANGRSPIQPAGKGCRPALGAKPEIL